MGGVGGEGYVDIVFDGDGLCLLVGGRGVADVGSPWLDQSSISARLLASLALRCAELSTDFGEIPSRKLEFRSEFPLLSGLN